MKIVAMIPARMGSTRLQKKNLALLDGQPLIAYAIQAAKESGVFDRTVINSEDVVFEKIASRYGVEFYKRPVQYATSDAKSDDVVYDFMNSNAGDILVWVNSIAPLQPAEEIKEVVTNFIQEKYDTLITVKNEQVHCLFDQKPLNYQEGEKFAKTQDLKPVQSFVYSLMMWRYKSFMDAYQSNGIALLSGKVGYYPVSKLSSIIIKTEKDLEFAHYILKGLSVNQGFKVQYDECINAKKT